MKSEVRRTRAIINMVLSRFVERPSSAYENLSTNLNEEQQECADRSMDDQKEYKSAGKPVPAGIIRELEAMGYIYDD